MKRNPFANPASSINDIKRVIDHWSVGRIGKIMMISGYHKVYTTRGIYLVFACPIFVGTKADAPLEKKQQYLEYVNYTLSELSEANQPTKRMLLPNSHGELDPAVSVVHYGDYHYMVYQLVLPNRQSPTSY